MLYINFHNLERKCIVVRQLFSLVYSCKKENILSYNNAFPLKILEIFLLQNLQCDPYKFDSIMNAMKNSPNRHHGLGGPNLVYIYIYRW